MKTLTLTLSPEKVNLLLAGLGELPAKHSMALVLEIQEQCKPQLAEKPEQPVQAVLDKDDE